MLTLFIFKSSSRGMQYGIGTYIRELTGSLLKSRDIKIVIVSYGSSEFREVTFRKESDNYDRIDIPRPLLYSSFIINAEIKYASAVVRILSRYIPTNEDIIFQMNCIDDLNIAQRLKEKYNYPIITIVHSALYQGLFDGNIKKLVGINIDNPTNNIEVLISKEKEFYSIADHIVSVTRYMKIFLTDVFHINPENITVIPNGINFEQYHPYTERELHQIRKMFGFRVDEIIILFSGRIDSCKGVVPLLQAFQATCRQMDNIRLILLGQGNVQEFQSVLKSDYGKVTFTGFLQKEHVDLFYNIADIGIVPSIYDHCPYSVLEMMANKLPLIMSKIEGLKEMLEPSECLFIDPRVNSEGEISIDVEELSELILHLAGNEIQRNQLADKSYRKLRKVNSAGSMSDAMKSLFMTLLKIQ